MESKIMGKNGKKIGETPSIILINPKLPRNVGEVVRASSCFSSKQVWFTGNRVSLTPTKTYRLPREERMKGYKDVTLRQHDYPFEQFFNDVVPVAIEIKANSEPLTLFEHPEKAIYVFGPEDGSIPQVISRLCHRFVSIPTKHCTNLAGAVYIVLYDRYLKRVQSGLEPALSVSCTLNEERGFIPWSSHDEGLVF